MTSQYSANIMIVHIEIKYTEEGIFMKTVKILLRLLTLMYIFAFTVAAVVQASLSRFGPDSGYTFIFVLCAVALLIVFLVKQKVSLNWPLPKPVLLVGVCVMVITFVLAANNPSRPSFDGYDPEETYPAVPDTDYNSSYDNTYDDGYDAGSDYDTGYDDSADNGSDSESTGDFIQNLSGFEYPLSEVTNLDGLFALDLSRQVLECAPQTLSERSIWLYDEIQFGNQNDSQYARLGYSDFMPLTVDRTNGEKLVLVGDEWDMRADARKDQIKSYATRLLGYGNPYLMPELNSIETIMDIPVSKLEVTFPDIWPSDYSDIYDSMARFNTTIAETPFSVHLYNESQNYGEMGFLLLSSRNQETLTYGEYEGTEYVTTNVAMITPYFLYDAVTSLPIERTMDGYFIIDISSLPNGLYTMDSVSGQYVINIK